MTGTRIALHTGFRIGLVDPRVFGGFLEHIGRVVYEGVYEPGSRHANEQGYRRDVLAALKRLDMTVIRYPGGNFASGYHWLDGVGPKEARPTVRELAWQSIETNRFGTDEFIALCRQMGWTPMLTANLGTGTPEEARNWVEYCNCPAVTRYADMRAANGWREPHAVKLWCLGNEMDGAWQLGHVPAGQYAICAQQAAKMMKDADKTIEVVACGSCVATLPTYMEWDRQVLEHLGDLADYVSLHRYVGYPDGDTSDFLAETNGIDAQIEAMDAACRFVQARLRSRKRAYLCFDEWNVAYKHKPIDGEKQQKLCFGETIYNLEDALVVAGFLHSFVRHADCVKIANLAQIVNVIAPLITRGDDLLIQSIFYPFEMFSKRRQGTALRAAVEGPTYESKKNGLVTVADTSAILDGRKLHVFVTNRGLDRAADLTVDVADAAVERIESAEILTGKDPKAANFFGNPSAVRAQDFSGFAIKGGKVVGQLPPLSFVAMTLKLG